MMKVQIACWPKAPSTRIRRRLASVVARHGVWVVHRMPVRDGGWDPEWFAVTHRPTGRLAASTLSETGARKLAKRLGELFPRWNARARFGSVSVPPSARKVGETVAEFLYD